MVKRILVLDDNEDVLQILKEALSYEKFDVMTISETEGVLQIAKDFKPHLVILDYKLNGSKGDVICRLIKTDAVLCNTPIIMCSAYFNKNDTLTCGCDALIAKPFGLNELLDKVNSLIAA